MNEFEITKAAADFIRTKTNITPQVAFILGSGLGAWADQIEDAVSIPYSEIPGFPSSTVSGHAGELVLGVHSGIPVVAMKGRVHAYEGLACAEVVRPLRTMWQLGARSLVVTNASGGVNPKFRPGELMLITDHINLAGMNPLIGHNDERFGPRFPDMTNTYTKSLGNHARACADELSLTLHEGTYAWMSGPCYETPAEIRMLQVLGASAVGMSTVPETIAARHLGMDILGIACITNAAAGLGEGELNHDDVKDVAGMVRGRFTKLIDKIVATWPQQGQ